MVFISHLTNNNGCGNLWVKGPLTVSPLPSFFLRQPSVFSRNRRLLPSYAPRGANISISPALNTLRILPVATGVTSPALVPRSSPPLSSVSSPAGAGVANPILSAACRLLFSLASLFRAPVLCFQQLADSFPKNRGV